MRRLLLLSLWLTLIMIFSGCVTRIEEEFVDFSVFVKNSSGQPIGNASVTWQILASDDRQTNITNSSGCASSGGINLAEGTYNLIVSAQNYKTLDYSFVRETINYFVVTLGQESESENSVVEKGTKDEFNRFAECLQN